VDKHNVRLVASDLDGTLLGPGAVLSPRTLATVEMMLAADIDVAVMTGRSQWGALPIVGQIKGLKWIGCSNGATLYSVDTGTVVERFDLVAGVATDIVTMVRAAIPEVAFGWESPEGVFFTDDWTRNMTSLDTGYTPVYESKIRLESQMAETQVAKLMICHDEIVGFEWLEQLRPYLPGEVSVSTSGAPFVEVTAPEANKGAALSRLAERLAVPQSETIAFGDHSNDLEMLSWAGVGFAMANAHPEVHARADRVAPHHAEDGVAVVLESLLGR